MTEKPPELRRLHEALVADDQIDHLGHMNVRFYHERALDASRALAALHGLSPEALEEMGGVLEVRDAFTRHYREQLVGAPLAVLGGVLELRPDGLRVVHELVNTERAELSAAFVHELALREVGSQQPLPLPEPVAKSAGTALVAWPEHGRPRTLDLDRTPDTLTLAVARERELAMRHERVVQPDECDAQGLFLTPRYLELIWGGDPIAARGPAAALVEMGEGGSVGWATLESRAVLLELPRVGTRIQSFGAEVELARKTSCRHHWVFDTESGRLLCAHSVVNLAFDIPRRCAVEIPEHIRTALESQYHPDLR